MSGRRSDPALPSRVTPVCVCMLQLYIDLSSSRLARHAIQPIQPIQPIQLYSYTRYTAYSTIHPPSGRVERRLVGASVAEGGCMVLYAV